MKYEGYYPPEQFITFWSWVHFSWNYIGGRPPMHIIGVRWFGHTWEKRIRV